jgi:hypothetical protein
MLSAFILAQRVLDLFEEIGATPAERSATLDVVQAVIRRNRIEGDESLPLTTNRFASPDDQDAP